MTKRDNKQQNKHMVQQNVVHNEKMSPVQQEEFQELNQIQEQNVNQEVSNNEATTSENVEEKSLEQRWLERILNHPIKTIQKNEEDEEEIVFKPVKEIIDPETDIWFSREKRKPIIKETGTRKLILATGATFPKIIPIEKQSDAPSKDREQVWIEATVLFPNGETHEEYGVANRMNCPDSISQSNLPIMARKRAMHRAFYRSDYIGLYDVYDENETLDVRDEYNQQQIEMLREKLNQQEKKYKKLVNQMCKEIRTPEGELVWSINDPERLVQLAKGSSLVAYIATLRLRHLKKKEKANS